MTLAEVPDIDTVNQTLTKNVKMSVSAGTKYHSSAFPKRVKISAISQTGITIHDDNSITLENPQPKKEENSVEVDLDQVNSSQEDSEQSETEDSETTQTESSSTETNIIDSSTEESSVEESTLPIESESNKSDKPLVLEFQMTLDLGSKSSYRFQTRWKNVATNSMLVNTTDVFALTPKEETTSYNAYIEELFQNLSELFSEIDHTSNMIATLYGSPGEDYSAFLSAASQDDFKNKSPESIYNMYGNIDLATLKGRLSDQDVKDFQKIGQENLSKIIETVRNLNNTIMKLENDQNLLKENLPESFFRDNLTALNNWYGQTMLKINETFKSWQKQNAATLEVKEWGKYDSTKVELYTETSNSLFEQIQKLVQSTEKSTVTISESSTSVKDNSSQFEDLVKQKQATTTQKEAKELLANTNNLVTTGSQDVGEVKVFYKDFSKTLANTRTKGVNAQRIYDFFASPIATSNITPKKSTATEVKESFDIRWLVIFSIGLFAGILVVLIGRFFVRTTKLKQ